MTNDNMCSNYPTLYKSNKTIKFSLYIIKTDSTNNGNIAINNNSCSTLLALTIIIIDDINAFKID